MPSRLEHQDNRTAFELNQLLQNRIYEIVESLPESLRNEYRDIEACVRHLTAEIHRTEGNLKIEMPDRFKYLETD